MAAAAADAAASHGVSLSVVAASPVVVM